MSEWVHVQPTFELIERFILKDAYTNTTMLIANRTKLRDKIHTDLAIWANKFICAGDSRLQIPRPYRIVTARKHLAKARFCILLTQSDAIDEILDMAYDHFGKNRRARAFNVFLRNAYVGRVRKRRKPYKRFHYYLALRIQKKRKTKWDCELVASVDKFCPFGQVIHKTIILPEFGLFEVRDGYVKKGEV